MFIVQATGLFVSAGEKSFITGTTGQRFESRQVRLDPDLDLRHRRVHLAGGHELHPGQLPVGHVERRGRPGINLIKLFCQ